VAENAGTGTAMPAMIVAAGIAAVFSLRGWKVKATSMACSALASANNPPIRATKWRTASGAAPALLTTTSKGAWTWLIGRGAPGSGRHAAPSVSEPHGASRFRPCPPDARSAASKAE